MWLKRCLLFLLVALAMGACTKDNTNGYFNGSNNYFYGSVNGVKWTATSGYAQTTSGYSIQFYATQDGYSYMDIYIDQYNGQGTYPIGGFNKATYTDENGTTYNATTGLVTVSSDYNSYVVGTFSFSAPGPAGTGSQAITVTGGSFFLTR